MKNVYSLNKYNVAPAEAKAIGVFDGEGRLKARFSLGDLPRQSGVPLYRFGVLADTHQNPSQDPSDENLSDLRNALSVLS